MKITDVKTQLVFAGWRNWLFVQVYTDEGLVGLGEATMRARELAIAAAIQEMGRFLAGRDPRRIEAIYQLMYDDFHWRGGPVLTSALSGLEIALWDILGQSLGVPIHQLLGGPCHDRVRCYANGWFVDASTPDEFARRAADAVARGFTALKWNPFHGVHGWISSAQLRAVVEEVRAVREAVGDGVDLLIECHGLLDPRSAVLVARELEPYRLFWLEEPVPPENVKATADVRQRSPIPVATGERLFTKFGFVDVLERQAADVIQPDVTHAGGFLETRKIAAMAEAHFVSVAPHNSNSPVATAATLHLDACLGNFLIQELPTDEVPWRDELLLEPVEGVAGGALSLPARPGLGTRLNEKVAAAHPYQPADVPPVVTPEIERLVKKGKEA
jgi:galactonate dehydratase